MTRSAFDLYLVRHAVAAERGSAWPDDDLRPLTRDGIRRFVDITRGLRRLDVAVDTILTSPLVRSRQTADVLRAGLSPEPRLTVLEALSPGMSPAATMAAVHAATRRRTLALVGHEPGLGELAAFLIGMPRPLEFKKGGVCLIRVPSRRWETPGTLIWLASPKLLRQLGRR